MFLKWYSSMKKKIRKIRMIFDIENWLWKSNFGTFWQLAINPKLKTQNSKFNNFLWVCWFLGKNIFLILYPLLENSTTRIAILYRNLLKGLWFWTYVFLPCFHHVYDKLFLYEVQKFFFISSLQVNFNNFLSRFEQVLF